ncbi:hypothetical protein AYO20_09689 [Fonsecaea nubica]|uniref:Enoyl reductase (ER) domain-containing protein n=1 Tax=Fonsecaea nubica TaxID=856822 RepID=A0A178CEZ6_9EURO|nr:hypothetical protein AYO20_09689 [Fonsecaea nubica]OAL27836.1 hypothetical protein AYO20_09689 [Fonsecaea nubica]
MSKNVPETMLEALVHSTGKVSIHRTDLPQPDGNEVLIEVFAAGMNPKDWKVPQFFPSFDGTNQGDDIAGVVRKVGSAVIKFKPGDRVAAYHDMRRPGGGAYADYAIAPEHATFHIPAVLDFERAATIPLSYMTAAVALFVRLGLPEPWVARAHPDKLPEGGILIYGGASAVGAYAIQLARYAGIHPIITVAGNGLPLVEKFLQSDKGDVAIDYRQSTPDLIRDLKTALAGKELKFALDAVADQSKSTRDNILAVMASGGNLTTVIPTESANEKTRSIFNVSFTSVGVVFNSDQDFGEVWFQLASRGLREGWLVPHPFEMVQGGLAGIQDALKKLQDGKISARKYVVRVKDTVTTPTMT